MASYPPSRTEPEPLGRHVVRVSGGEPADCGTGIEFRELRYFVSVAEDMHFGQAASRLFISQPALSQAIARLERALDVKLFDRTRRRVELTEAGAELLQHARRLLADREDVVERVRRLGHGEAGVLRVGVALPAEHQAAPAIDAFAAERDQVVLDRSGATSERLIAQVSDREIDVAFVVPVPVLHALEVVRSETIRRLGLVVLVGQASALAARESVRLAELSEQTFLVNSRKVAPSAFEGLKTMCYTFGGFEPRMLESTSTLPVGHAWRPITEGIAIAVMPQGTVTAAEQLGIAKIPLQPPPDLELALIWRRGNHSPFLQRFIAYMRAYRDDQGWRDDPRA